MPMVMRRPFFGWVVVTAGTGVEFVIGLALQQVQSGYAAALTREFGWSRGALGLGFSLSRLENGVLGPAQGWLIDRFGPRAVMRAGLAILAVGFLAFSRVDSLAGFYVTFGVMSLGAGIAGFMPISAAVVQWFRRYRSRALALAQLGFAVSGLFAPPVILAITTLGWRQTAVVSAAAVLLVGIPLTGLVHGRPEERGLRVDGLSAEEEERRTDADRLARRAPAGTLIDFTAAEALRTSAFWLISFGHAAALLIVGAVMVHLFLHLTDSLGYPDAYAAGFIALLTASQIVGQVVGGYLGDRFDKRALAVACMGMHSAALLLLAYAWSAVAVGAFAVLHGAAWGARGPLMQAIRADYFGASAFGLILGLSAPVMMIGLAGGPVLAGILYDATGSYTAGFTAIALIAAVGSAFFVFAAKPAPPRRATPPAVPAEHSAPLSDGLSNP